MISFVLTKDRCILDVESMTSMMKRSDIKMFCSPKSASKTINKAVYLIDLESDQIIILQITYSTYNLIQSCIRIYFFFKWIML